MTVSRPRPAPRPDLLAPAGSLDKLRAALAYGADAVYLGGPEHSLRAPSAGFPRADLATALDEAYGSGAAVHYCVNILPRPQHMPGIRAELAELADMPSQPDALIIADPGVLALAREIVPHIPIHLSTQANAANAESVRFWTDPDKGGAARVVLARELDAPAIRAIRAACPEVEIEIFAQGAMCMAVSGRCLLSAWLNERHANLGDCTHPCRFAYRASTDADTPPFGFTVEEKTRPDEPLWDVVQDGEFHHFFAAEDLSLVKYLPWFFRMRIAALKVEGRMKSAGHVAQVTDVYATALKDWASGTFRPALYLWELRNAASRPLSTGFFLPDGRRVVWQPLPDAERRPIVGQVVEQVADGTWRVAVRAAWDGAADICVLEPGLKRPRIAAADYGLEKDTGETIERAHSGTEILLKANHPALRTGLFLRHA